MRRARHGYCMQASGGGERGMRKREATAGQQQQVKCMQALRKARAMHASGWGDSIRGEAGGHKQGARRSGNVCSTCAQQQRQMNTPVVRAPSPGAPSAPHSTSPFWWSSPKAQAPVCTQLEGGGVARLQLHTLIQAALDHPDGGGQRGQKGGCKAQGSAYTGQKLRDPRPGHSPSRMQLRKDPPTASSGKSPQPPAPPIT